MREFAEAEIVIPDGPYEGRRFKCDRQPFSALWFGAVDSGRWRRFNGTGPQQSGKTLMCSVIPTLYHLFEIGETVIFGVPSLDMIADKWREDLLPAIEASRFRDFLPKHGAGSRGGNVQARIEFTNGATLRFMTGGGNDKTRAAFTSRVVIVTETDGMDKSGGSSREADKITQLEGRTRAYGDRARVYLECTVSIEEGRTWQEFIHGTASRIVTPCPHCKLYVTLEREHLVGWKDAENVMDAGRRAGFACPECGHLWTEADRIEANHRALLVHKGEEVTPEGKIVGQAVNTDTLGFRWNAANNLLIKTSVIGMEEYRASRAPDEENAEKAMRQFWWTLPHRPAKQDLTKLRAETIMQRTTNEPRGRVPANAQKLSLGVDLGQRLCHWSAPAWRAHATPHLIDYGRLEVASDTMGLEHALLTALRDFRDTVCLPGWPSDQGPVVPALTLVDSGWQPDVVYEFCAESGPGFLPSQGHGAAQARGQRSKREPGTKIILSGPGYEVVKMPSRPTALVEINVDIWKSWLHARIQTPVGQPGAFTLYQGIDHFSIAKHLTAERQIEEFIAGKGNVTRWEFIHRNNHWLDATVLACVAGHILGARLMSEVVPQEAPTRTPKAAGESTDFVNNWKGRY